MSMAFVEGQVIANATGVATTPAFTNTFALGQLVVVTVNFSGGTNPTTSVTDNASTPNTYTLISGASIANGATLYQAVYYAVITTAKASPTVTVNYSSASNNAGVVVQYFNGFVGTPTLDQSGSSANTTSTTVTSGASSGTTQNNELVIGMGVYHAGTTTFTLGAGYTNLTQLNNSTDTVGVAMESNLVATMNAQTATFTLGTTNVNIGGVLTFYDTSIANVHVKFNNSGMRPYGFSPGIAR
jgi:hypothetical protein